MSSDDRRRVQAPDRRWRGRAIAKQEGGEARTSRGVDRPQRVADLHGEMLAFHLVLGERLRGDLALGLQGSPGSQPLELLIEQSGPPSKILINNSEVSPTEPLCYFEPATRTLTLRLDPEQPRFKVLVQTV